jgi:uncharacterized membrane protein YccF (DUF307 family)
VDSTFFSQVQDRNLIYFSLGGVATTIAYLAGFLIELLIKLIEK